MKLKEEQIINCMSEFGKFLRNRLFFDNQDGSTRYFRNVEIEMWASQYFDMLKRENGYK